MPPFFDMTTATLTRRNLYGRYTGRPLSPTQKRLLAKISASHTFDVGELDRLRGTYSQIWLEIGFGAGEHFAWQAKQHPRILVIGAEYFLNGFARACKHIDKEALQNVRLFRGDGRDLMDLLPAQILSRAFILHPDPWPKARQWRRRLICPETLNRLYTLMRPQSILRISSDHGDYQPWMMRVLEGHPGFVWTARTSKDWTIRPRDWPQTRYEAKSIKEGRPCIYIEARRR